VAEEDSQANPSSMPDVLAKSSATPEGERRHAYPLSRGWVKHKLIHEIARDEKSTSQLAEEYGVTPSAISQFKTRHRTQIDEVKADIENEFAGLWIAQKKARLAEYQHDADRISESDDPQYMRIKAQLMKAVAEEMGHLPTKTSMTVSPNNITYVIEGVNPEDLQ
jgi:hypothetical protein